MQIFFLYNENKVTEDVLGKLRKKLIEEQGFEIQDSRLGIIRKDCNPPIHVRIGHPLSCPYVEIVPVPKNFMKSDEYRSAVRAIREKLPYKKVCLGNYEDVDLDSLVFSD